jgi:hypothetical protein
MFPTLSSKQSSTLARACASLAFLAATCASAQLFTNPYRIPTPSDPNSVAVGDINGDGLPDILWSDAPNPNVPPVLHVLLAQAVGGFSPGTSFTLPVNSTGYCLLVDFNHDHHLDLACTNAYQLNSSIQVFLGNGDGTFQAPITTPIDNHSGSYAAPILESVGDLNGDGFPDLIEEDFGDELTQVLLGDGTGGFKPGLQIQGGINGALPTAADVNGDGIPDLLFPQGPSVELGKGDGTFGPSTTYAPTLAFDAGCVFHDMDGDGHLDAVCGYAEGGGDISGATDLIILHGNPDGSFNTTPIYDKTFGDHNTEYDGYGTFLTPTYVGDVNGDGILDILGNSGDGTAVLLGGPSLTFGTPLHYPQAVVGYGSGIVAQYQSQIVDMNLDGRVDLVACGPNGIYISYAQPNGSFAAGFAPEVTETIGYPTLADFNGDGIPDIAATGDTAIKLSLGKGDGTFAAPTPLSNNNGAIDFSTPLSTMNAHILHGDFNGDGKLDLLAIGSPGIYVYNSYILYGHGNGTFDAPVLVPNSSVSYPMYAQLTDAAVFDINQDGRSDLLSTNNSSGAPTQISFALSNGDGSFRNVSTTVPSDVPPGTRSPYTTFPALADFNRDGKLDAAYASYTNAYVVKGHGDGTFDTTSTALPLPAIAGQTSQYAIAVATGDFDGDSNQDFVVLAQYGVGQFPYPSPLATAAWAFYGNGNGTFSAPVLVGTFDRNYTGISVKDLNDDGLADIVLQTSGSLGGGYAVGAILSQADRSFGAELNFTAGTGLSSLAILDVNHDGFPDLVFGNGDYNVRASSVTVLLNQRSTIISGTTTITLTSSLNPSTYGQPVTFTATVSSPPGHPTGSVTFSDGATPLGTVGLDGNGMAQLTTSALTANDLGTTLYHQINATYLPTDNYTASSASLQQVVNGLPSATTLVVTPTSGTTSTSFTLTATVASATSASTAVPTGEVVFYSSAQTNITGNEIGYATLVNGVATLTTSGFLGGSDYIVGIYFGDTIYASSTSNYFTLTVAAPTPAVTLISSLNPAPALTPITFTAQLPAGSGGTVIFNINSQNITTSPNTAGTATTTISTLTQGTYPITATWFASASALSAQASLTQVVTPLLATPDFSLTGTNITFKVLHSGTGNLQLASINNFAGSIALTCNPPYPANYTCTLQSPSITLTAGATSVVAFTLNYTETASVRTKTRIVLAAFFPLTLFSLIGLGRKRRTTLRAILSLTLLAILATATTACGPDHFIPITTGTFPITFTATGTSQGTTTPITHTTTINATIAP